MGKSSTPGLAIVFALLAIVLPTVVGCERGEAPIVVYVSVDEHVARPILDAFSERTGIPVHMVGDTEATKTTGLVDRIRSERNMPVADVFWSSEAFMTIQLAREGLLKPHQSSVSDAWMESWRDPEGRWFGFSPRPRVLVFDPGRLDAGDVPSSLEGLAHPRYRDRIVMADPRFGTTGGHLAALRSWYRARGDVSEFEALLVGLGRNGVRVLPGGNAAVVEEVRSGRAWIGLTDADDVRAINRLGAALEMKPVGPVKDVGTFLMPNTVALVAGCDHPRAGELLDELLSDRVARTLAESVSGNVPLSPRVAVDYPHLQVPGSMPVDFDQAATDYAAAVSTAVSTLHTGVRDAAP